MISAVTTAASDQVTTAWGQGFSYDGFGNLTAKTVLKGSVPTYSVYVDPGTNRVSGTTYDANGNAYPYAGSVYDAENRLTYLTTGLATYGYDAQNKRIFISGTYDSYGNATGYTVMLYSPGGQKLGTYRIDDVGTNLRSTLLSSDIYFGSRRISTMDRLGSVGKFYPYGEGKGGTNPADTWSFATYWRDSATNLDYADQRYYASAGGRFMTPDPYTNSGRSTDPQSWNRYSYVGGDPVNRIDPEGNDWVCVGPSDDQSCYDDGQSGVPGGGGGGGGGGYGYVVTNNWEQYFQSRISIAAMLLSDSERRIIADLAKADCAKDFKNASNDVSKLSRVFFRNQGLLQLSTGSDGTITVTKGSPGVAKYNSFFGYISLNNYVNWVDPSQTRAQLDGNAYTLDLLAGQAAALGVPSVTAAQYMDLTILHELSHYNGAIGNPDKNPSVEMKLWTDCIK